MSVVATFQNPASKIIFKCVKVSMLKTPYPPVNELMCRDDEIRQLWTEWSVRPLPDKRDHAHGTNRPQLKPLDMNKLQYIVQPRENIIFVEAQSRTIIGQVCNGFLNKDELSWLDNEVDVNVAAYPKDSVRLQDPGNMCMAGYTCGPQGPGLLQWSTLRPWAETQQFAERTSISFAHLWSKVLPQLHPVIKKDYDNVKEKLGGMTMDAKAFGADPNRAFDYKINGKAMRTTVLAPLMGNVGKNYARETHKETNANEFCITVTTSRSRPTSDGGDFYIAKYGILVPGATGQLVAWRGADLHGTTLARMVPGDKESSYRQAGFAFIIGSRVYKAYQNYKQRLSS